MLFIYIITLRTKLLSLASINVFIHVASYVAIYLHNTYMSLSMYNMVVLIIIGIDKENYVAMVSKFFVLLTTTLKP